MHHWTSQHASTQPNLSFLSVPPSGTDTCSDVWQVQQLRSLNRGMAFLPAGVSAHPLHNESATMLPGLAITKAPVFALEAACVQVVQQSMAGKHESVEKLLADLEQRNSAAREAGAGQDMTVDMVVRPCEVAQTIHDMVAKSRPRNLIAPAPTLPTISPPQPQEEEKEEEQEQEEEIPEPERVPEAVPEPVPEPERTETPVAEVASAGPVVSPAPEAPPVQGPNSDLTHAEGTGKEVLLQVCC